LSLGQGLEEVEVKEGVHWSVISTKTIFIVAMVYGDFDTEASVDETNDSCRNADIVCVSSICSTCKTIDLSDFCAMKGWKGDTYPATR